MIECLICGKEYKRVCSHVRQKHGITAREYKKIFGYDVKKGIISDEDKEHMAKITKENGTIDNLKKGKRYRFKKNHKYTYTRSNQTLKRLKELGKNAPRPEKKRHEITCFTCGKKKMIVKSQLKERNYCCRSCSVIHRNKSI